MTPPPGEKVEAGGLTRTSPKWEEHLFPLPELYPDSAEFLRRLDDQLPEAAQWFREWHAELRLD